MTRTVLVARRARIAGTLWAILAIGCITNPVTPSQPPLGQPFELRRGAPAILQGGLTVVFTRMVEDSRCPIDALCVHAGNAAVEVTLSHQSADRVERELHTNRSAVVTYLSYTIRLVQLSPVRRAAQTIKAEDYAATLTVTMR